MQTGNKAEMQTADPIHLDRLDAWPTRKPPIRENSSTKMNISAERAQPQA